MSNGTDRYHGLDLLRSLAMLLGIVFHAPMFYYIPEIADGFRDFGISTSMIPEMELWLQLLVQWSHNWRMTVFFIISGFFALMVIQRKGAAHFVKDRVIRLGLALILFATLYDMLDGEFQGTLDHLWFIYYLLIFSLISSAIWRGRLSTAPENQTGASNRLLAGLLLAFVPMRMVCDMLDGGAVSIAGTYADIKLGGFVYFAFCFLLGSALFSSEETLNKLASRATILVIGTIAAISFAATFSYVDGVFGHRRTPSVNVTDALLGSAFAAVSALSWSMLLIGVTHTLIKRSITLVKWLVELSYPVYLVHLLPVMVISAILISQGASQITVVLGTVCATFTISVNVYYILIKFTPINWIISGYQKSWLRLHRSI